MSGGWIYILTNRPNGTLYVGVTSDLSRRMVQHQANLPGSFASKYGLKHLVHVEHYDDIGLAIQREKNLKHWPRAWKIRLILRENPDWADLIPTLS